MKLEPIWLFFFIVLYYFISISFVLRVTIEKLYFFFEPSKLKEKNLKKVHTNVKVVSHAFIEHFIINIENLRYLILVVLLYGSLFNYTKMHVYTHLYDTFQLRHYCMLYSNFIIFFFFMLFIFFMLFNFYKLFEKYWAFIRGLFFIFKYAFVYIFF